jgi:hypothetical protein
MQKVDRKRGGREDKMIRDKMMKCSEPRMDVKRHELGIAEMIRTDKEGKMIDDKIMEAK